LANISSTDRELFGITCGGQLPILFEIMKRLQDEYFCRPASQKRVLYAFFEFSTVKTLLIKIGHLPTLGHIFSIVRELIGVKIQC
jgi:hypothetical protein